VVISGHQWSSVVISGHQWSSVAISDNHACVHARARPIPDWDARQAISMQSACNQHAINAHARLVPDRDARKPQEVKCTVHDRLRLQTELVGVNDQQL